MALTDRTDLFQTATVNGNLEYDWLSSPLMNYTFLRTSSFTVPGYMANRLDLISNAVYGSPAYWWLIGIANSIMDPFDDLPAGTVIIIPDLDEYFAFYQANVVPNVNSPITQ